MFLIHHSSLRACGGLWPYWDITTRYEAVQAADDWICMPSAPATKFPFALEDDDVQECESQTRTAQRQ